MFVFSAHHAKRETRNAKRETELFLVLPRVGMCHRRSSTLSHISSSAILVILLVASALTCNGYRVPCNLHGLPVGCDDSRFRDCMGNGGGIPVGYTLIEQTPISSFCIHTPTTNIGQKIIVRINDRHGNCKEIQMQLNECWGMMPGYDVSFDCMGRCGIGCGSGQLCSNWAYDCLRHDVAAWYYSNSTTNNDTVLFNDDTVDEYIASIDDNAAPCRTDRTGCSLPDFHDQCTNLVE